MAVSCAPLSSKGGMKRRRRRTEEKKRGLLLVDLVLPDDLQTREGERGFLSPGFAQRSDSLEETANNWPQSRREGGCIGTTREPRFSNPALSLRRLPLLPRSNWGH